MKKIGNWVFWAVLLGLFGSVMYFNRPGEEGRILDGMSYEEEDEEVCSASLNELEFSGEPESDRIDVLKGLIAQNAVSSQAALSPWRTVNVLSALQGEEADWSRDGDRYVIRLVAPTPLDDDATFCLYRAD